METLYSQMKKSAIQNANKTAIVFYGKKYTFSQILELVDRAAAGLEQMGVKSGDVVTLCVPNTPSAQIAFYAINRIGAINNLVHPFISAPQLNKVMSLTGSKLLIAYDLFLSEKVKDISKDITILCTKTSYFMGPAAKAVFFTKNRKKLCYKGKTFESLYSYEPLLTPYYQFKENEPAVYLPSGGTSGIPKTIVHNNRVFNELCSHAQFFLSEPIENYKAMYSVLPVFHGFGLCMNMHMCALYGVKNVMSTKFNPKSMAKAIKKEKINILTGVPAMYAKLLKCKQFLRADLSSIKDCFVGGDSVSNKLVEEFNAVLEKGGSKSKLYIGYGLTETVTVCTVTCKNHYKPESIGYPLPNTKIAIVKDGKKLPPGEIGEICLKTPLLMLHYLGEPFCPIKEVEGEKWLFTGDLGYLDVDGFLYFKQRIKNMIKVSGVPVYPSEIEKVVEGIEGVIRCAAIGVPDDKTGEIVKLFVESKTKDKESLKQNIIKACELNLLPYAVPRIIEIRESLPLNTIGKVDRNKLS